MIFVILIMDTTPIIANAFNYIMIVRRLKLFNENVTSPQRSSGLRIIITNESRFMYWY